MDVPSNELKLGRSHPAKKYSGAFGHLPDGGLANHPEILALAHISDSKGFATLWRRGAASHCCPIGAS